MFFISKPAYENMLRAEAFKKLEDLQIKLIIQSLNLPKKGQRGPIKEMMYKFMPDFFIVKNYIKNYVD